jgi:hypothetical protein
MFAKNKKKRLITCDAAVTMLQMKGSIRCKLAMFIRSSSFEGPGWDLLSMMKFGKGNVFFLLQSNSSLAEIFGLELLVSVAAHEMVVSSVYTTDFETDCQICRFHKTGLKTQGGVTKIKN